MVYFIVADKESDVACDVTPLQVDAPDQIGKDVKGSEYTHRVSVRVHTQGET